MTEPTHPPAPDRSSHLTLADRDRLQAVLALCEGRPAYHLMTVQEILTAANAPAAVGEWPPLTLRWDPRTAIGPAGGIPHETVVPCRTQLGGRAALVLGDEQRLTLGALLLAQLHAAETCQTQGCGYEHDLDENDPTVWGWIQVHVHGTDGPPRWWCSSWCASSAITAAGAELAAADHANAQAPVPYVGTGTQEPAEGGVQ